jgi:hypothetical protein
VPHRHYFLDCSIATAISRVRNLTGANLAQSLSANNGWPPAGTVQSVLLGGTTSLGHELRPIAVGTETDQISSVVFRTFHGMANAFGQFFARLEVFFAMLHPRAAHVCARLRSNAPMDTARRSLFRVRPGKHLAFLLLLAVSIKTALAATPDQRTLSSLLKPLADRDLFSRSIVVVRDGHIVVNRNPGLDTGCQTHGENNRNR